MRIITPFLRLVFLVSNAYLQLRVHLLNIRRRQLMIHCDKIQEIAAARMDALQVDGHFVGHVELTHIEQLEIALLGRRVNKIVQLPHKLINIVTDQMGESLIAKTIPELNDLE